VLTSQAILNISTQAIHQYHPEHMPIIADRPDYGMTKMAGTLAMQYIAQDSNPDEVQVISYHPGSTYTESWQRFGISEDFLPFDDGKSFTIMVLPWLKCFSPTIR